MNKKKKKKQDLTIFWLNESHFSFKDTHRHKMKRWIKIGLHKLKPKRARIHIFTSDKIDFKPKTIKRDSKCYYLMKKVHFHQLYIFMHPALDHLNILSK